MANIQTIRLLQLISGAVAVSEDVIAQAIIINYKGIFVLSCGNPQLNSNLQKMV